MIEWILATLKAGGAFVYLDPALPELRKQSILDTSKASVIVMDEIPTEGSAWLAEHREHVVIHDTAELVLPPEDQPLPEIGPNDLAYIIYTSGSTGKKHIQPRSSVHSP